MPGGAGAQLALRRLDKNIPHIMLPKEERKKEKTRGGVQMMMLLFKYSLGSFIWCVCVRVCVISEIILERKDNYLSEGGEKISKSSTTGGKKNKASSSHSGA